MAGAETMFLEKLVLRKNADGMESGDGTNEGGWYDDDEGG
jgi:hypothetical protein